MVLRTMIHPHCAGDEVKEVPVPGAYWLACWRVLAVMLQLAARAGSSPELSWERK
jgi:hypothetical protein